MKQFVCLVCVCILFNFSNAQHSASGNHLNITTNKTTSLIFPFAIKHVDRGTQDVLVQQVSGAENLLLVKASAPRFKETNLSVVTADGALYSFKVTYDSVPQVLVYRLSHFQSSEAVKFKSIELNEADIETHARGIIDNKKSIAGIKNKKWNMLAKVIGIYIKENVIFYQLLLNNRSLIDFDIDFLRFYIRDKRKSKRTASQEVELKPLSIAGNTKVIRGDGKNCIVVALEKFTIPHAKFLAIEISEKNGGRNLLLKLNNNKIIKARSLPDLH